MAKIAIIDEWGAYLLARKGRFILKVKDKSGKATVKWEVAPVEVDTIVFTVTGASISAEAVKLASDFGIDLVFMDRVKPVARLLPSTYGSTMRNWKAQIDVSDNPGEKVKLARLFIEGKIHNQRIVLREWARRMRAQGKPNRNLEDSIVKLDEFQANIRKANAIDEVMSIEAHAAKRYWSSIAELLPSDLGFTSRETHKLPSSLDPFNRALNIGYSILRKETWRAVFLAGLNPYIGFLHSLRSGKMSLVFDLMEEFRPIAVDRPLIALARSDKDAILKLRDSVKSEGLAKIWSAVASILYSSERPLSTTIVAQARLLAKHLKGTDTYKPFKARW
ncbi:MAG: CRISPR-associated endonuclease Cas1 [Nitrososphaerota archaeon]|nr:CRISPR-associated endonuclease Cas1 [Candidatus Bathyarchaeota archaeon]MCX8162864.1 CRISPR-associated endonuclease Cas1 [Candidatus Bathyarchaeota archaeon]MDW8061884.1 CRISPR-associated endonuclease Cas1 [Nitrososphaerota archaeon]